MTYSCRMRIAAVTFAAVAVDRLASDGPNGSACLLRTTTAMSAATLPDTTRVKSRW